jgi:hypothetical protein
VQAMLGKKYMIGVFAVSADTAVKNQHISTKMEGTNMEKSNTNQSAKSATVKYQETTDVKGEEPKREVSKYEQGLLVGQYIIASRMLDEAESKMRYAQIDLDAAKTTIMRLKEEMVETGELDYFLDRYKEKS